jgi:hypothetical protein
METLQRFLTSLTPTSDDHQSEVEPMAVPAGLLDANVALA